MINTYKKPEILAPCGSYDIMIAAINAGADACYFGGNKFGARAYATNFDIDTSLKAIDYAHIHGTSLYLTVNTLFKNNEIDYLYDYIKPYYEAGLDAVIVQDLGVLKYIRENFPDMPVHCSTQMNITSKFAAKAMKDMGASRIVTAREMSLSEIKDIKDNVDIEIESFVHGAMCYSYSGRCLMSSLAGGRSGNRGRCAQPCRKCYDGEYILSMKDMCTLKCVPKLIEAGIDSLKIEGRMKNEYYVASAVDAYNQIADDFVNGCYSEKKAEELQFKLANIYNRGGFCQGYYYMHNGPEMISKDRPNNQGVKLGKIIYAGNGEVGIKLYTELYKQDVLEFKLKDNTSIEITSGIDGAEGAEIRLKCPKTKHISIGQTVLRTRCNNIIQDINDHIINSDKKYDIYGDFTAKIGEEISFTIGRYISNEYIQVTVLGNRVEEARDKEANIEDIKAKLSQLGNTCYSLVELNVNVDKKAFIPASVIKSLRRDAIDALDKKICQGHKRKTQYGSFYDKAKRLPQDKNSINELRVSVGAIDLNQLEQIANRPFVDNVYLNLGLYKTALEAGIIDKLIKHDIKLYLSFPHIVKSDFDVSEYLQYKNINGIYINNIDGLFAYVAYIRSHGLESDAFQIICGDGIYAYNNYARDFISNHIKNLKFELSRELNKKELCDLDYSSNELVVYEHQQVMLSAQCVIKNKKGCNQSNSIIKLCDDKKNVFYARAVCDECCNIIYNGVPYMILNQINQELVDCLNICSIRFNLTIEDKGRVNEILDIIKSYKENYSWFKDKDSSNYTYTSGHFNRGVE